VGALAVGAFTSLGDGLAFALAHPTRGSSERWPLERILFALAGTMTLLSALLGAFVSPWFLLLTAFVGINQWLYVTVGACPASLMMHRLGVAPQCARTGRTS
jgi:hypothetical protein